MRAGYLIENAARAYRGGGVAVAGDWVPSPGGVVGPEGYWAFLANGGGAITEVPADRRDADGFYDPDPLALGRISSKWGGFLTDVAVFDADYFGIPPGRRAPRAGRKGSRDAGD